ncbi:MAG: hypothetical protein GX960_17390 [Actinomycetales bacterium]|nr:hypothetical protein [Actinomycetales bacterium]
MSETAPSPMEPTITERDMLGAMEVLAGTAAEPEPLIVLTDEEIMALDGLSALEILGSPYLSQDAVDAETSAASALRSLVARGMVRTGSAQREEEGEAVSGGADPSQRPVQLDRRLAGVVTLRRIPEAMVTSERTLEGGTTTLAHYFFPRSGVLEEYITVDGFHHFSVPHLDAVAARIQRFADPFEVADADGEPQSMALQEAVASFDVDDTRALTVLTAVADEGGRRATIAATSAQVQVLDNGALDSEPSPTRAVQISAVSPETLLAVIDTMLPRAEADGEDEGEDATAQS